MYNIIISITIAIIITMTVVIIIFIIICNVEVMKYSITSVQNQII